MRQWPVGSLLGDRPGSGVAIRLLASGGRRIGALAVGGSAFSLTIRLDWRPSSTPEGGAVMRRNGLLALGRAGRTYPRVVAAMTAMTAFVALDALGLADPARWMAIVFVTAVIGRTALTMSLAIVRGQWGLDVLAMVAMTATLATGEYLASLVIVLMMSGGAALEDHATRRADRDLTALLNRSPQRAHVLVPVPVPGTSLDPAPRAHSPVDVAIDEVRVGDVLLVRPAEVVPVDGELLSDEASFDESSLTGESMPVARRIGEEVPSGAVNGSRAVRIRAVRNSAASQYQQIVSLVREAHASRAPVVRLADRFAVPFTVVSLLIAALAWALSGDAIRFAEVLVLATPCPLLIAAPVAFLGGLSRAARSGVIIKGGAVLEQLAGIRSVAFDKTGTLTVGRPRLIDVRANAGVEPDRLLSLAASAEQYSSHVLAEGIRAAALARGLALLSAGDAQEHATNGVSATIDGCAVAVGKPAFIQSLAPDTARVNLTHGQAAAYVSIDGQFGGVLLLADDPRPEAAAVVDWLRRHDVERIAMLTGDVSSTARTIASATGMHEVLDELLPGQKVAAARSMQPRPVMMVGDGVNDAPALAAADVGIAMGAKGATAAGEAADAVILRDSLLPLVDAVAVGRHTLRVAYEAIWIGVALSIGLMLVATSGAIPALAGALVQEFVDLATILYALRALSGPSTGVAASGS